MQKSQGSKKKQLSNFGGQKNLLPTGRRQKPGPNSIPSQEEKDTQKGITAMRWAQKFLVVVEVHPQHKPQVEQKIAQKNRSRERWVLSGQKEERKNKGEKETSHRNTTCQKKKNPRRSSGAYGTPGLIYQSRYGESSL